MSRTRYNHLRHDRELEGVSHVPHMPQPTNAQPYTRAELMQRGAAPMITTRTKRLPTLSKGLSPRPVAVGAEIAANRRMCNATRTHFLPRVAKLASNSNNNNNGNNKSVYINTGKTLTRDKSPARKQPKASAYLNSVCDSSSLCARGQKLPLQQQQHPHQQQQQQKHVEPQKQQLPLLSSNGNSCSASSSMSNSSNDLRKIKVAKAFRLPDEQNKSFVYLCKPVKKVKQLLMVRSLNNSVEDLAKHSAQSDPSQSINHNLEHIDSCSSLNLAEQLELDCSYQGMLETQLQDVRQREQQLQQLAAKVQWEQSSEREPAKERERDKHRDRDRDKNVVVDVDANANAEQLQRNMEMEFVCQNIPTLQREIKLLQQLGEKLEATLRANIQCPTTTPRSSPHADSRTVFYTPRSTLNIFGYESLPIVQLGWRLEEHMLHLEHRAQFVASLRCFGCIQEFRIETKTLTELKTADETQCFYLPLAEDGGLQRTSFRKLRENPNVLLQQLRPVTPARPFNLLEQDAMFFNSMLSHGDINASSPLASIPAPTSLDELWPRESGGENHFIFALSSPYARLSVRPQTWTTADVERMLVSTVNATVQCEIPPAETPNVTLKSSCCRHRSSIKCRQFLRWQRPKVKPIALPLTKIAINPQRKLIARQVAPLKPLTEDLEPEVQTQLLKTVLVGIVQVAVFLVLIMAFTYPDIRC
ncbi:uncharacterized protein LOC117793771 [Drosophila innubila]|uniref:uncharacterized protein LOC117793771 n=1 Tax=Drosophila innubila TaxID=198719 RepID=UPI00148D987D|nr:uncharacterized protein LOC117793771 [Drosophila innubila]